MTRRATLLVVDDDPSNIEVLHAAVCDEYDVLFATDGPRALEIARASLPDAILLDVMMPGMDGYEVCTQLKHDAATAPIPVLFVTGHGEHAAETRGLEVGAMDYITKPINPLIVRLRVRNHVELRRARQQLEEHANTDALTLLANRRSFDRQLEVEFRRLRRSGAPLSLIMIDVDHFKKFNDTYGHVRGDDCLRRVAAVLRAGVQRVTDVVTRYGGEEFAVILPETPSAGARVVAESMRRGVSALEIPHAGSSTAAHVTISLGVATGCCSLFVSGDELVALADAQLYGAKSSGRDRVVAAERLAGLPTMLAAG